MKLKKQPLELDRLCEGLYYMQKKAWEYKALYDLATTEGDRQWYKALSVAACESYRSLKRQHQERVDALYSQNMQMVMAM